MVWAVGRHLQYFSSFLVLVRLGPGYPVIAIVSQSHRARLEDSIVANSNMGLLGLLDMQAVPLSKNFKDDFCRRCATCGSVGHHTPAGPTTPPRKFPSSGGMLPLEDTCCHLLLRSRKHSTPGWIPEVQEILISPFTHRRPQAIQSNKARSNLCIGEGGPSLTNATAANAQRADNQVPPQPLKVPARTQSMHSRKHLHTTQQQGKHTRSRHAKSRCFILSVA